MVERVVIGDATLYCGDCATVLPTLAANSIDLLWTDPPYGNSNHEGDFNARLNEHRAIESKPIANDDLASMQQVNNMMLREAVRLCKPISAICACCGGGGGGGPTPVFAWLAQRMDAAGLTFFHSVIWDKKNPGIGWRYRRQHEMIMVAHRSDGKLSWADENVQQPNIISLFPPKERQHPNEKPLALMELFIQNHSLAGDVVLDSFMGSGSTGVAALKLKRKFIGIELDPAHFATACRRIEEASKQDSLF